jgi:anti-sigma factor (TIGR02949 family)
MNVTNFDEGQCRRIRSYLDAYLNSELLVETNLEVLKHLERCRPCEEALETRARVRQLLQRAVLKDAAPPELKARIQREIRRSSWLPTASWMIAAAATIALAFGVWTVLQVRTSRTPSRLETAKISNADVLKIGLGDHVHCAVDARMSRQRFSEEEMAAEMGPEYIGLVSVVRKKIPGDYEIAVAHRCNYNERKFVHLIMVKSGTVLSVVITKKNGEAFRNDAGPLPTIASGIAIREERIDNLEVAGFETKDYLVFVSSNLSTDANLVIASSVAPGVRDFLAKLEV